MPALKRAAGVENGLVVEKDLSELVLLCVGTLATLGILRLKLGLREGGGGSEGMIWCVSPVYHTTSQYRSVHCCICDISVFVGCGGDVGLGLL